VATAFQPANRGGFTDAFVAKLSASGSALVYSSYLGGTDQETANGIAVDATGNAYVTAYTQSADFPTTAGAFQTAFGGGTCFTNRPCADAFVTKVASNGSLAYSTFLGGSGNDNLIASGSSTGGIAVDSAGNAYVTGATNSTNFPVRNPVQASCSMCDRFALDVFVSKLNPTGSALVYSTYLGGTSLDVGYGIAVDTAGSAYVTGFTTSTDFPVVKPLQRTYGSGDSDVFVSKLDPSGSSIVYSTFLGGVGAETGRGIGVDSRGAAYITG
jgi:hypothetical protein